MTRSGRGAWVDPTGPKVPDGNARYRSSLGMRSVARVITRARAQGLVQDLFRVFSRPGTYLVYFGESGLFENEPFSWLGVRAWLWSVYLGVRA